MMQCTKCGGVGGWSVVGRWLAGGLLVAVLLWEENTMVVAVACAVLYHFQRLSLTLIFFFRNLSCSVRFNDRIQQHQRKNSTNVAFRQRTKCNAID